MLHAQQVNVFLCGKGVLTVTCSTCVCTGMGTLTVPCVSETGGCHCTLLWYA